MKSIWILILLLALVALAYGVSALIGPQPPPPWEGPEYPPDYGPDCDHFDGEVPDCREEGVEITDKGVLTCVNVTLDLGCTVNVTFQWLNWSLYFDFWIEWAYAQDWWWGDIDWDSEPTWENDSFWFTYASWDGLSQSMTICEYNINVTCFTDNDYESEWFDWRVIGEFNCSGNFTNETCYFWFEAEECPISFIYPPSPNGSICPCCDAVCFTTINLYGHKVNISVYLKEENEESYHIINTYTNISNGTYCFCIDGLSDQLHAVGHTDANITAAVTNNWYNVSFAHFESVGIAGNPSEVFLPVDGHYTLYYWATCIDTSPAPAGHKMGFRMTQDGQEINGTYREIEFDKQQNQRQMMSFAHFYGYLGASIRFQYIVNALTVIMQEEGTWASHNTSAYAMIILEEPALYPMKYNTTYNWYVNVTDVVTDDYDVSDIFQFRTARDIDDCFCGNATDLEADLPFIYKTYIVGLLGLIGLAGLGFSRKRRRK